MPEPVEERLRSRERALGWALSGLALLGVGLVAALLLLALPLIVVAFPLTLSAILAILLIGRLRRHRRTRRM